MLGLHPQPGNYKVYLPPEIELVHGPGCPVCIMPKERIDHAIALSAILFAIGAVGAITRRNLIVVLMSIELMLNAVNLALVAFSRLWGNLDGQVFVLMVIVVAAAEVAVGLGIVISLFRNRESVNVEDVSLLKW